MRNSLVLTVLVFNESTQRNNVMKEKKIDDIKYYTQSTGHKYEY